MGKTKGWSFNGISPALGPYKIVDGKAFFGVTGINPEMGNPPENYAYTGVEDLDTYKDSMTFKGITDKVEGFTTVQVGVDQGLTGISGEYFTNKKHEF